MSEVFQARSIAPRESPAILVAHRSLKWLLFADHGTAAMRNAIIAWAGILCFAIADAIWMPQTNLRFASGNWTLIARLGAISLTSIAVCAIVSARLRSDPSRIAAVLLTICRRAELIWRGVILVAASATVGGIFCYLATMAAWPLQDAALAEADRWLGLDWLSFVALLNRSPGLSHILVAAYYSTGFLVTFVFVWLCVSGQVTRFAELLATLSVTTLGVGIGMTLAPAIGPYTYLNPARELFSNFTADAGTSYVPMVEMLRASAAPVVDFATADGIVTFPSFHTVLGVITTYAVRDSRLLGPIVFAINATMIVATLPQGGHYLVDVIAGMAIAAGAIVLVRWNGGRGLSVHP